MTLNKTFAVLSTLAVAFLAFGATAVAAGEVSPDDGSLLDLARPVMDAVMKGNYWLAAALGVILLTAATRKYLPDAYGGRLARSQWGGRATAFLYAFAGAIANAAAVDGTIFVMTGALAFTALKVGGAAIGGFMALHELAKWFTATKWYQAKMPAPLKALIAFVLGLIGSSTAALAKAEKAGDDAVKANPPTGAEGPVDGDVGKI